jgi:hypothetical protein
LTKEDIQTDYPLPGYNYRVEVGGDAVAFSEVSGLSIAYETSTYKESPTASGAPGPRTMIGPGQRHAATSAPRNRNPKQRSLPSHMRLRPRFVRCH